MLIRKTIVWACLAWVAWISPSIATDDRFPPWPAERHGSATLILDHLKDQEGWSGAHWNSDKNTLWVCRDNGRIRAFHRDAGGWQLTQVGNWDLKKAHNMSEVDCEGITQRSFSDQSVMVVVERSDEIREYDVSAADPKLIGRWDISPVGKKPDKPNNEMEGLVFVPDEVLKKRGFVNRDGNAYPKSRFNQGGVVFLAQQRTGKIFAVDLQQIANVNDKGTVDVIGVYKSGLEDTRGLELDRSKGVLYGIDGERFFALRLSSELVDGPGNADVRTNGPGTEGAEGLAVATQHDDDKFWVIVTDDDRADDRAILLYQKFDSQVLPLP